MEHRCGERIATTLPATVRTGRGEAIRGTIRNLSCGGAFLALPATCTKPRGFVDIEVCLPYAESQNCRWKAYVVHRHADGVGLMFDEVHLADLLPFLGAERATRRARRRARAASVV